MQLHPDAVDLANVQALLRLARSQGSSNDQLHGQKYCQLQRGAVATALDYRVHCVADLEQHSNTRETQELQKACHSAYCLQIAQADFEHG